MLLHSSPTSCAEHVLDAGTFMELKMSQFPYGLYSYPWLASHEAPNKLARIILFHLPLPSSEEIPLSSIHSSVGACLPLTSSE
jgi:hypothetical protein